MTERRIDITIHIKQPRAVVFAAWSSAEAFASWFAPMAESRPVVQMDFRVEGAYCIEMPMPDGSVHTTRGVYETIVANEKIVMTWRCDAFPDPESRVVVTFHDADGGTDIHLVQEPFDNDSTCVAHMGGWQLCLAQLQRWLDDASHE